MDDRMLDLLTSDDFRVTLHWLGIACLLLAVGLIVIAFAYYGRTRDIYGRTPEKQRWTLLMGTWRDSLIITLLYISEGFLYRFADFQSLGQVVTTSVWLFPLIVQPVMSMVLQVLMFMVAIMRIIVISRWLAAQAESEAP